MDIVITYVDGLDPIWQKDYERHTKQPVLEKRFRDWGTLRYLLRGIEQNMPFIRKVHLVVSHKSQVPEWINRNEVHVVLHSDIIPEQYLPTFNSTTIEMFLHQIAGLDEEFLYFNDDMFPLRECKPTDFFRNGKGVLRMSKHWLAFGMFKQICRNSDRLARRALNMSSSLQFLRPQHICSPMLKSLCEELYNKVKPEILASLSRTRNEHNLSQYLFLDYMYLKGEIINERLSKKHFSLGMVSAEKLHKFIVRPTHLLTCINDVRLSEKRYKGLRAILLESFDKAFPNTSRFER